MKTFHTRSPTFLVGGLALALMTGGAFAASPPADPDPSSKTPMEDSTMPTSTTPYSKTNPTNTTSSDTTTAADNSKAISMQSNFDTLDVNHDGYIDKQEAAADSKLNKQFAKLDANKDNKLSVTEFSNAKGLALNKKSKSSKTDNSGTKDQYQ